MMKTTLHRLPVFIALFVYFNYCHYMLMTTIPFSYPTKWVMADLYLCRAVLSSNFEDLNKNNGVPQGGRIVPFNIFFEPNVLINCFSVAWRFRR